MKFIFFGTDGFSVVVLETLKTAGLLPVGIVTAPDRPKGRGLLLAPSRVKVWAQENAIPILQSEALEIKPDLFVVASYGLILPPHLLAIPTHGALNLHPSLLPKYRGATPIESQILADEKEMGVSIIRMDEEMDHGPVIARTGLKVRNADGEVPRASEVRKICAREGGALLAEVMPKWVAGEIEAEPQDDAHATYTKKFVKSNGEINLSEDAYKNLLKIRAFDGGIGTYFFKNGVRVVIKDADVREGKLTITRVVPEGKREMGYEEFLRGLASSARS